MIGIVVATFMLVFGVPLSDVLLAFIGFELFGISIHLNYFHITDKQKRNSFASFVNGLRKGLTDGKGNAEHRERDKDGNGE